MLANEKVRGFARRSLAKAYPDYAARRFEEIHRAFVEAWAANPTPYRAALETLPENERLKAIQLFDLTIEWLYANEQRKAEIDEIGGDLVNELAALDSRWFIVLIDLYAPPGSDLRAEWESCLEGWAKTDAKK